MDKGIMPVEKVELEEAESSVEDPQRFRFRVPQWVWGLVALGLVAGGGYWVYGRFAAPKGRASTQPEQAAAVERVTKPVTISANGVVQPAASVNVSPKNSGILKALLVKEGDRVSKGQILARMDDSNLQGQLIQAEAQLASAQANLTKLEAGNRPQEIAQVRAQLVSAQANLAKLKAGNRSQEIAQVQAQLMSAQANLRQTELNFQQNQQLYASGAISQRDFDTSRTTYDQAKAQVDQASQALSLQQAGTRPEDITQAQAQVEQLQQTLSLQESGARSEDIDIARAQVQSAEGALVSIQTQVEDTVIRAPFSGLITRKYADPGAFVTPTTSSSAVSSATSSSILAIASNNEINVKVAETSISKIKLGQGVTIVADAFPGKTFKGKVTQVATQSTIEQNVTNFEVKTSVNDPQKLLQAGMNVVVKFDVGTLDNALVVPTVAIVRQKQGTGVFMAGKGKKAKAKFQRITTGATVEDKTVVLSGLKEGDRVLLSFPKGERPTSRVPRVIPGAGPGGGGGRRGGG